MPRPSADEAVLACDLDGTLVRVNTFPSFVRFALLQLARQRDVVGACRLGWALVSRKLLRTSHLRLKEEVHRAGLRLGERQVEHWARALLASEAHPDVQRLLAEWRGRLILCTAAPSCYAEVLGAVAGFGSVQGSGWVAATYVENVHEAKATRLAHELGAPLACAVTDDVHLDGPLLALAAQGLVVDAQGRLSAWTAARAVAEAASGASADAPVRPASASS
jgi:phosphoserine phosphatase